MTPNHDTTYFRRGDAAVPSRLVPIDRPCRTPSPLLPLEPLGCDRVVLTTATRVGLYAIARCAH